MQKDSIFDLMKNLKDIDINECLQYSDGNPDTFEKLLKVIYTSEIKNIDRLEIFTENNPDVELLRTIAHGIKSSLASIGAVNLSMRARDIELAVKEGRAQDIIDDRNNFKTDYITFLYKLRDMVKVYNESKFDNTGNSDNNLIERKNNRPKITAKEFSTYLRKINDALKDYDMDEAEGLLSKIREYHLSEQEDKLITKCDDLMLSYDFNEIIRIISIEQ